MNENVDYNEFLPWYEIVSRNESKRCSVEQFLKCNLEAMFGSSAVIPTECVLAGSKK
jgi:hypothetical protein